MALFKFRWPGQKEEREQAPLRRSRTAQAESVDDMRRRARHRLIGAAVLVVLGVIGFPILFDTQPRPIPVDVPIEIPDRNQVAPMMVPGNQAQTGGLEAPLPTAPTSPITSPDNGLGDGEELVTNEPAPLAVPKPPEPPRFVPEPVAPPKPEVIKPKPEVKPEPKPESKPTPKPEPVAKPEPKSKPAAVSDAERARALLEGRAPQPAPTATTPPAKAEASKQGRFIVQVGAFADASKANEVRSKLERAGLKTYTQAVNTKDGKRTRVRVGPFDQRSDADQAAARIKGLGLAASVLTL